MKILKAKIEVTHIGNGTQYVGYPKVWLDNKEKIPLILYPNDRSDEIVENGKTYQIVYPVVPESLANKFLQIDNFSLPTTQEVEIYGNKHAPVTERITNEKVVLGILAKSARGEVLTKKEKDALDPNNPEVGVNISRSFIEIAKNDYGVDNI